MPIFDMVAFDEERIGGFFRGWFVALQRLGFDVERGRSPEEAVRGDVRTRWLAVLESRFYHDEKGLIADGTGLGLNRETRAAFKARLADDNWRVRSSAVEYFAQIGADDERTRAAVEARLAEDDMNVRAAAVTFFVDRGLRDQAAAAFAGGASASTSTETDGKLSEAVGRLAATDDVLLKRITKEKITHFNVLRALAAAAVRRDEIRRESTPLADVLAGRDS